MPLLAALGQRRALMDLLKAFSNYARATGESQFRSA